MTVYFWQGACYNNRSHDKCFDRTHTCWEVRHFYYWHETHINVRGDHLIGQIFLAVERNSFGYVQSSCNHLPAMKSTMFKLICHFENKKMLRTKMRFWKIKKEIVPKFKWATVPSLARALHLRSLCTLILFFLYVNLYLIVSSESRENTFINYNSFFLFSAFFYFIYLTRGANISFNGQYKGKMMIFHIIKKLGWIIWKKCQW